MSRREFIDKMLSEEEAIFTRCKGQYAYYEIKNDRWINERHFVSEKEANHFSFYDTSDDFCFSFIEVTEKIVSFRYQDEAYIYMWTNSKWRLHEYHNFRKEEEMYDKMTTDRGVLDDLVRLMKSTG